MGQVEIYKVLENARLTGDDSYFRVCDIKKLLKDHGYRYSSTMCVQVAQLEAFGYLETNWIKRKRSHWRGFRIKDKYIQKKPLVPKKVTSNTPKQVGKVGRHVPRGGI